MRQFLKGKSGFTLVELMVVMAILGVLSAIVFPSVTGITSAGKATGAATDINQVRDAVQRFNSDDTDGSPWPTAVSLAGASTAWAAGKLPTGTGPTGTGLTSSDPFVFTQSDIAGIDFASAATTVDGVSKTFYPDFLTNKPRHADETISVGAAGASVVFEVKRHGATVYVKLSNTHTASLTFSKWGLDKGGNVWVFVSGAAY